MSDQPTPTCKHCGYPIGSAPNTHERRGVMATIDPERLFCSLRCAAKAGVEAARAAIAKATGGEA